MSRPFCVPLLFGAMMLSACNQNSPPPSTPVGASTPAPTPSASAPKDPAKAAQPSTAVTQAATTKVPEDDATKPATEPESTPPAQAVAAATGPDAKAAAFVDALAAGEFDKAVEDFDATMSKVMPADKVKQTWETLKVQAGDFKKRGATRLEQVKDKGTEYDVAFVTCEFEKMALDARIVYTKDGRVTGLFFSPAKPKFASKEELWLGELNTGAIKLRIMFHLGRNAEGKQIASMDSLDQNQKGIPLDVVTYENGSLKLEGKALGVSYEGKLDEGKKEIIGEWKQGGASLPLNLKQVDSAPQANRPQTPKPPFPYKAIDVSYENKAGGVKLAGTLTVPNEEGQYPAALLITGSGPQDRDETIFDHKPFLVIADYLTRRGIAVLRVDDRGVGGSTKSETQATSADFAGDVLAGIEFLKTRPEIDQKKIGLIGHSEGGLIAPLVASQSDDVAFIVMLAGSSVTGEEILYRQGAALLKAAGVSEKGLAAQREMQSRMFAIVKSSSDESEAVDKIKAGVAEYLDSLDEETRAGLGPNVKEAASAQAANVAGNWFRFFLTYDPRPALEMTRCPVLALNGSLDLQVVPEQNLPVIREALTAGGNEDFEVHEFPGLNHLFQPCKTGQVAEYGQIETTFDESVLKLMGDWILKRTIAAETVEE